MSYSTDVNEIQSHIIRRLFSNDALRFSDINNEDVPSDRFSYHLRQLLKYDIVEKTDEGLYRLSVDGRSRAIMLDAKSSRFIHQGFVACRMVLSRAQSGGTEYLMQKRTRVPYIGYIAEPGGKVLFGESVLDAAVRNMRTETGLTCTMTAKGITHFMDNHHGEIVQDKFFFIIHAKLIEGELAPQGPTGENHWMTQSAIAANPMVHEGVLDIIRIAEGAAFEFLEGVHVTAVY